MIGLILGIVFGSLAFLGLVFLIWWFATYNSFIRMKNTVEESFSTMDVYLKLRLESGYERVDIEVSDKKLSQSIIDRNILYGAHKLVTQLQRNKDYSTLEPIIIVSFSKGRIIYDEENNNYYTDDKVIEDTY